MKKLGELFQTEDWKKEKHVPLIESPESVKSGEKFQITVTVGKEISHPNTTEHHIRWVQIYFHPDGEKYAYQLANCEFTAHGEAAAGPNQGPAYTDHNVTVTAMLSKPGVIHAMNFCNIHGLWENSRKINVTQDRGRYAGRRALHGFLVSSVKEAASRIVQLLKDEKLRQRMGKKAMEDVRKNYLLIRLLEQYLDLLSSFETCFTLKKK